MSTSINITDLNIPENLRTGDRISCRMGDETIEAEVAIVPCGCWKAVNIRLMRIMKSISLKRESLEAMICDSFKRVYADLVQQCTHAEDLKMFVESRMIFVR